MLAAVASEQPPVPPASQPSVAAGFLECAARQHGNLTAEGADIAALLAAVADSGIPLVAFTALADVLAQLCLAEDPGAGGYRDGAGAR